jgi:hypothetical protein
LSLTNKHLKDLLPSLLREIEGKRQERPDLILEGWHQIIDEKWRSMTQAISFEKGTLMIKVRNAALHMLVQQEKGKLLKKLQQKFPEAEIKNIIFRIG